MSFTINETNIEKKVFDIIIDHARIALNGAETLSSLIDCWTVCDIETFDDKFKKINHLEVKANNLKNSALQELSKAGPALIFRQDLTRIVREIDQVIDLAQGAAFFFQKIDQDWLPPENIATSIQKLTQLMIKTVKSLIDVIRALYQNIDRVREIYEDIDRQENNVDVLYRTLIIETAKLEAPKDIVVMIRESVDRIEDMVDSVRDAASNIRLYAMAR